MTYLIRVLCIVAVAMTGLTLTAQSKKAVVIPQGYHAHQTADGKTIIHSDSNNGVPGSHNGLAGTYRSGRNFITPKTGEAGQVVEIDDPADPPAVAAVQAATGPPAQVQYYVTDYVQEPVVENYRGRRRVVFRFRERRRLVSAPAVQTVCPPATVVQAAPPVQQAAPAVVVPPPPPAPVVTAAPPIQYQLAPTTFQSCGPAGCPPVSRGIGLFRRR